MRNPIALGLFAISFTAVYFASFMNGWALFRFYPLTNTFTTADLPRTAGPAMGWYAWIVQGFVAGVVASFLAHLIPKSWANRVWSGWTAAGIISVAAFMFYVEWHWFVGK